MKGPEPSRTGIHRNLNIGTESRGYLSLCSGMNLHHPIRGNSSVDEGTLSRETPTGRVEGLKTMSGGAVSFAPPSTPKPSTTSRTVRGGGANLLWTDGQETRRRLWSAVSRLVVDF